MIAEFNRTEIALAGTAANLTAGADAYAQRVLGDIKLFTDWLTLNSTKGYIGEFGWPNDQGSADSALWNEVAESFYEALDVANCWATPWVACENTPYHNLNVYSPGPGQTTVHPLSTVTPTSRVLEAHPTFNGVLRGVNMGGSGENGEDFTRSTGSFSNAREYSGWSFGYGGTLLPAASGAGVPENNQAIYGRNATYAKNWNYGTLATYQFLASRGHKLIRLPFRWERMQRSLGGSLDVTETVRYDQALTWIGNCGMQAIVDMHNFGYYYLDDGSQGVAKAIGGATATGALFADFWSKFALRYKTNTAVAGYGLCNEPTGATNWTTASTGPSALAAAAIRSAGAPASQALIIAGPGFCTPSNFTGVSPWITDSQSNTRYECHSYWDYADGNNSTYASNYAAELAAAVALGYGTVSRSTTLLASVFYSPVAFTAPTYGSAGIVDVDATNLKVTFIAPASGKVLIRLSAVAGGDGAGSATFFWGVREASTQVGNLCCMGFITSADGRMMTAETTVTGLTPGTSHTYKWAHATGASGHSYYMAYGGAGGFTSGAPAIMEVWAA